MFRIFQKNKITSPICTPNSSTCTMNPIDENYTTDDVVKFPFKEPFVYEDIFDLSPRFSSKVPPESEEEKESEDEKETEEEKESEDEKETEEETEDERDEETEDERDEETEDEKESEEETEDEKESEEERENKTDLQAHYVSFMDKVSFFIRKIAKFFYEELHSLYNITKKMV